jgi:hypothetical protein
MRDMYEEIPSYVPIGERICIRLSTTLRTSMLQSSAQMPMAVMGENRSFADGRVSGGVAP